MASTAAGTPSYSASDLLWKLHQDVELIKQTMVTQESLKLLMDTKQDKGVSEERWRQVHEDIGALQSQPQVVRNNLFQGWNAGVNGCILAVMVAGAGTGVLAFLASVAAVAVALLKP